MAAARGAPTNSERAPGWCGRGQFQINRLREGDDATQDRYPRISEHDRGDLRRRDMNTGRLLRRLRGRAAACLVRLARTRRLRPRSSGAFRPFFLQLFFLQFVLPIF